MSLLIYRTLNKLKTLTIYVICFLYFIFRTKYEIDGITDFFGTHPHAIGYAIEYFLKKYTEKKLLEHIKIIEQEYLNIINLNYA